MVHKGELKAPDGSIKVVAIKTIKCKLCDVTMCMICCVLPDTPLDKGCFM